MNKYFVTGCDRKEREVTIEEYCAAEREAGFRPKGIQRDHPSYLITPATSAFSARGISG